MCPARVLTVLSLLLVPSRGVVAQTPAGAATQAAPPAEPGAGPEPSTAQATPESMPQAPDVEAPAVDLPPVAPERPQQAEPPEGYQLPPPPLGPRYPGPIGVPAGGLTELAEGPRIPGRISTRLRVLSTDLDALASRGSSGVGSGVLSIVTGGLSIALTQILDTDSMATLLYVFGISSLVRGALELALTPDAETAALTYAHMPMRVPEEVMERLNYGERSLHALAMDARKLRLLDGAVSIAGGAITIPLVLLDDEEDGVEEDFSTLDLFVVIGAGVSILSGTVSLFSKSEEEKRDHAYRNLRRRLRQPPKQRVDHPAAQLRPSAGPGHAGLRLYGWF